MSSSYESIREKANLVRSIDLLAVLDLCGAVKDRFDKAKWHTQQGTISICGPKFMNWSQGVGGGGAIDLVMHLKSFDFKTAVLWLSTASVAQPVNISAHNKMNSSTGDVLQLPKKDETKIPQLTHYLVKIRSIPQSIIMPLIHSGKLYADTRGNAVFLLLGKKKMVVGAELRGTHHTSCWHGMAKGSRKDLGFFWVRSFHPEKVVLCESAIDALSLFTLFPNSMAISTSGAYSDPVWLKFFMNAKYEIYCGFDSDETGERVAQRMMALYPAIKRLRPQEHDWNEVLKSKAKR